MFSVNKILKNIDASKIFSKTAVFVALGDCEGL